MHMFLARSAIAAAVHIIVVSGPFLAQWVTSTHRDILCTVRTHVPWPLGQVEGYATAAAAAAARATP
jgi:hypothetical protein